MPSALQGGFLTTGPPGKSERFRFLTVMIICFPWDTWALCPCALPWARVTLSVDWSPRFCWPDNKFCPPSVFPLPCPTDQIQPLCSNTHPQPRHTQGEEPAARKTFPEINQSFSNDIHYWNMGQKYEAKEEAELLNGFCQEPELL